MWPSRLRPSPIETDLQEDTKRNMTENQTEKKLSAKDRLAIDPHGHART